MGITTQAGLEGKRPHQEKWRRTLQREPSKGLAADRHGIWRSSDDSGVGGAQGAGFKTVLDEHRRAHCLYSSGCRPGASSDLSCSLVVTPLVFLHF